MKDAYEVLDQKETDLARVRQEIDSLRIVVSLLMHDPDSNDSDETELIPAEKTDYLHPDLEAAGTDGLFSSAAIPRPRFWNSQKRAR
jgi:hypothetical protein